MEKKMPKGIIIKLIMFIVSTVMLVSITAGTLAWFQHGERLVTDLAIEADGVLWVAAEFETVHSDKKLSPAVLMSGALSNGLPYDVLKQYNPADPEPSYVKTAATIIHTKAAITVNNIKFTSYPVKLPEDREGYVRFPVLRKVYLKPFGDFFLELVEGSQPYEIPNKDDSGTVTLHLEWTYMDVNGDGEYDKHQDAQNGAYYFPSFHEETKTWGRNNEYSYSFIQVDYTDSAKAYGYNRFDVNDSDDVQIGEGWRHYGEDFLEPYLVEPDSNQRLARVFYNCQFKKTNDPQENDYLDSRLFCIDKVYFSRTDSELALDAELGVGNTALPFETLSSDKLYGSIIINKTERLFMHFDLHLAFPDELIDYSFIDTPEIFIVVSLGISAI